MPWIVFVQHYLFCSMVHFSERRTICSISFLAEILKWSSEDRACPIMLKPFSLIGIVDQKFPAKKEILYINKKFGWSLLNCNCLKKKQSLKTTSPVSSVAAFLMKYCCVCALQGLGVGCALVNVPVRLISAVAFACEVFKYTCMITYVPMVNVCNTAMFWYKHIFMCVQLLQVVAYVYKCWNCLIMYRHSIDTDTGTL